MSEKYTTVEQRVSYGIGRQMGDQLASNSFEGVDAQAVAAGVVDSLGGVASVVAESDLAAAFQVINERMQAQQAAQAKEKSGEGEAFLAENAQRDEVTVLESGLQYEVVTDGSGDIPTADSVVKTHYRGTLINGQQFDSSYDRGQPAEFPVGGVIAGWTEALQQMKVGSKWKLYIPYHLAYGEAGAGGDIGPYQTLIFDIELLDIIS